MLVGIPINTATHLLVKMRDSTGAPVTGLVYNTNSPDFRIVRIPADGSTPTATAITLANSGNYLWTELGDGYYTVQVPASGGTAGANNDTKGALWASGKFSTTVDALSYPVGVIDPGPALSLAAILALSDATKGLKADLDYARGESINQPVDSRLDVRVGEMGDNVMTAAAANADLGTELAAAVAAGGVAVSSLTQAALNQVRLELYPWQGLARITGSPGTNQIQLTTGASSVDSAYLDRIVTIVAGTGADQARNWRRITAYVGSSRMATVDAAWDTVPDATSYVMISKFAP